MPLIGDFTRSLEDEADTRKMHRIAAYNYYPTFDWNRIPGGFDIALLRLADPLTFDTYRQPLKVCSGRTGSSNPRGYTMKAIGLGYVDEVTGELAKKLMVQKLRELYNSRKKHKNCIQKLIHYLII